MQRIPLQPWQRALLVLAPSLVLLLFGAVLLDSMLQRRASTARVQMMYARLTDLHELRTRVVDAETGQRGYLITEDSAYLRPSQHATADVAALLRQLAARGVPDSMLAEIDAQVSDRFAIMNRVLAARAQGIEAARRGVLTGGGIEAMRRIRGTLDALERSEQQLLQAELQAQDAAGRRVLWVLGIGILVVLATAFMTNRQFGRYTHGLEQLNSQLQEQAIELELQSQELQLQAGALEERTEELEAMNELLEERTREAEAANVAKSTFLRTMSHELRTPLNAIEGYSDLLELEIHGPLNEQQHGSVQRIRHNSRHLLVLINDVLSYARIEAGRLEVRGEHVDLAALFEETEKVVRPELDRRGVEFRCIPPEAGLVLYADADRTRQILVNLLGNAVKYAGPDSAVLLSANGTPSHVDISVSDTGPGIPAEMQEVIFDPFVQLNSRPDAPAGTGAGLGLAISRGLARSMGGDLTVTSQPGSGARFRLSLPRSIEVTV